MWRFLAVAWIAYLLVGTGVELYRRTHPAAPAQASYRIRSAWPTPALPWRQLPTIETGRERRLVRGDITSGTAFALRGSGVWATARHVVDGCELLTLEIAHERHWVTDVIVPYRGDAAVILTDLSRGTELGLGGQAGKMRGSELPVFALGYPQARSGAAIAQFIEEVLVDNEYGIALGAVWAVDRLPLWLRGDAHLGGISGGPVVDGSGSVRGIAVGGNPRRRWLITIDPRYATEPAAASIQREPRPQRGPLSVTPGLVDAVNERLQAQGTIGQVVCRH